MKKSVTGWAEFLGLPGSSCRKAAKAAGVRGKSKISREHFEAVCPAAKGRKRVYISGPMTGEDFNAVAFSEAAERIREDGNFPIIPHDVCYDLDAVDSETALKRRVAALVTCDSIFMLRDWENDDNSEVEHELAWDVGLFVTGWREYDNR